MDFSNFDFEFLTLNFPLMGFSNFDFEIFEKFPNISPPTVLNYFIRVRALTCFLRTSITNSTISSTKILNFALVYS